jgi:hypothetical protein
MEGAGGLVGRPRANKDSYTNGLFYDRWYKVFDIPAKIQFRNLHDAIVDAPFMEPGKAVEAIRQSLLNHANIGTTTDPAI